MRGLSAARAARGGGDDEASQPETEASSPSKPSFYDKVKEARRRAAKYLSLLSQPEDEDLWKKVGRCMKGIDPGAQSRDVWVKWTGAFKDKRYCQMVWETLFKGKKQGGDAADDGDDGGSTNSALASSGSVSVSEKLLQSIHKRICKEDVTKLVSKQEAVRAKQVRACDGHRVLLLLLFCLSDDAT